MTKINNKNKKFNYSKIKNYLKIKSSFQKILSSKIFIAVFFAMIGVYGTVLAHNINSSSQSKSEVVRLSKNPLFSEINHDFDSFHDKFFSHDSFFAEFDAQMRQMQKDFDQIFAKQDELFAKSIKRSQINDRNSSDFVKIEQSQDDDFVKYKLNFKGYDKDDILVLVKDETISFSANKKHQTLKNKDNEILSKTAFSSNFYYSFSLPKNIDDRNPIIEREDEFINVKFKKVAVKKND